MMWNSMKYMKWTAYRIGSPLPPSWQLASAVASGISNIASLPLSVLLLPNMLYWQIYIFQMYIFYIYIHLIICGYHYFYIFIYIICMYLTYCVYWFKLLYVGFFFFFWRNWEKNRGKHIYAVFYAYLYILYFLCSSSFLWIWVTISCLFFLFWWTSLSLSCNERLLAKNSLSFCWSRNVFIPPSFLKNIFSTFIGASLSLGLRCFWWEDSCLMTVLLKLCVCRVVFLLLVSRFPFIFGFG